MSPAQGSRKSLAALAALADKLKSHGQIMIKITYILSKFCTEMLKKVFDGFEGLNVFYDRHKMSVTDIDCP